MFSGRGLRLLLVRSWVLGNEAHENRNGVLLFILLCVREKCIPYNERSDVYVNRKNDTKSSNSLSCKLN